MTARTWLTALQDGEQAIEFVPRSLSRTATLTGIGTAEPLPKVVVLPGPGRCTLIEVNQVVVDSARLSRTERALTIMRPGSSLIERYSKRLERPERSAAYQFLIHDAVPPGWRTGSHERLIKDLWPALDSTARRAQGVLASRFGRAEVMRGWLSEQWRRVPTDDPRYPVLRDLVVAADRIERSSDGPGRRPPSPGPLADTLTGVYAAAWAIASQPTLTEEQLAESASQTDRLHRQLDTVLAQDQQRRASLTAQADAGLAPTPATAVSPASDLQALGDLLDAHTWATAEVIAAQQQGQTRAKSITQPPITTGESK